MTFDEDFPETHNVAIGEGDPAAFAPYQEGATVAVVQGNQGAFMITPSVRVEAWPGDDDRACFRILLRNGYQGALPDGENGTDASQSNVRFIRAGGALFRTARYTTSSRAIAKSSPISRSSSR